MLCQFAPCLVAKFRQFPDHFFSAPVEFSGWLLVTLRQFLGGLALALRVGKLAQSRYNRAGDRSDYRSCKECYAQPAARLLYSFPVIVVAHFFPHGS
jgi:hypothetical protein